MPKRLAIVALLITFMAGPAYPQRKEDILQLMKDMIDLQQLVRQLQTSVDRDNTAMKSLMEKMSDQVNPLSGGLQKINQAVDSVKTQNDATTREMKKTLTTLNSTVKEL